jgi:hypothetical protein
MLATRHARRLGVDLRSRICNPGVLAEPTDDRPQIVVTFLAHRRRTGGGWSRALLHLYAWWSINGVGIVLARPSVASLALQLRAVGGGILGTATGFVVERNGSRHLVTNWHVASGRRADTGAIISPTGGVPSELVILHNLGGTLGTWTTRVEPLYAPSAGPRSVEGRTTRVLRSPSLARTRSPRPREPDPTNPVEAVPTWHRAKGRESAGRVTRYGTAISCSLTRARTWWMRHTESATRCARAVHRISPLN